MNRFKVSSICLSLLVLGGGCSSDPEPEQAVSPSVLDDSEKVAVELKIPGVGGEPDTAGVAKISENVSGTVPAVEVVDANAAANGVNLNTQTGASVSSAEVPRPLLLSDVIYNRFDQLAQGTGETPFIGSVFYPLGWSPDGKLAYAIEPLGEAVGDYFLDVYIQDLVTDKILWRDKYRSSPDSGGHQSFAAYWMAKESGIGARFKKYGIRPLRDVALFSGPINVGNDQIQYAVTKKVKAEPSFGDIAMVSEYRVNVSSATRGKKSVHKKKYTRPLDVLDVDVIGYLRSDDPERVALLVAGIRRGWEGPPHVVRLKVVGANLVRGFKK
ncbi:MAG: hypothetical protein CSB47_11750 [Proteobacteria bacterium]|nr:MAG: hypothetical protein CSB47_11750 [Pseudomonadota bacterium]